MEEAKCFKFMFFTIYLGDNNIKDKGCEYLNSSNWT